MTTSVRLNGLTLDHVIVAEDRLVITQRQWWTPGVYWTKPGMVTTSRFARTGTPLPDLSALCRALEVPLWVRLLHPMVDAAVVVPDDVDIRGRYRGPRTLIWTQSECEAFEAEAASEASSELVDFMENLKAGSQRPTVPVPEYDLAGITEVF